MRDERGDIEANRLHRAGAMDVEGKREVAEDDDLRARRSSCPERAAPNMAKEGERTGG
jgi:hypothetical protein